MHKAEDVRLQFDKSAKRHEADNFAFDSLTDFVFFDQFQPGIGLEPLEGKRNAIFFDRNDLRPDFLADFEQILGMLDPAPGQFGNVDQSFQPVAKFEENPEIHDSRNFTFDNLPDFELGDLGAQGLFAGGFFGND